ncbi:MAG: hypothetical protein UV18_C0011G0012 [Candidatus Magasanikbacteria bacterium GW2011_GWC2_42_27]|nr:MAG: hypothetical protein UV18_C0011G0012 [Candidatus Magasanikbacteria bacterium GW2011_GWC2_42_27]
MREDTIKKMKEGAEKDFSYALNETGDYRESWRIFRIMAEFVEGYQFLDSLHNEVTVFGSARFAEDEKHYIIARAFGKLLAEKGYTTITGGGPGIMEAANRGAQEGNGPSVGINIQLPFEQRVNPYVGQSTAFYYFFTRKVMLTSPAHAHIFFPGGFGTFDEFFEVVHNIEIGKMCQMPIVLVGREYWEPVIAFIREKCVPMGSVKLNHVDTWNIVDTAEEAIGVMEHGSENLPHCDLSVSNFHSGQKNMDWRIFRIMSELVEGFEFLTGLVEDVTVLGTRHIDQDSHYYKTAYDLGTRLAESGYAVVTGGSVGISEAVNKGAMEAGGESLGIGYITKSISFKFPFTRKLIVTAPSKGFIFFPGGLGTLHHLFEVLTLIETKKMQPVPIILIDHAFWEPMHAFIKKTMVHDVKSISDGDDELYQIVDTVDAAMTLLSEFRPVPHGKQTL